MGMMGVAQQMVSLFAIVAVGFVLRRLRIVNDAFDATLTKVVFSVTLPCMVLSSLTTAETLPSALGIASILGFALASYALILLLAVLAPMAFGLPRSKRGVYSFAIAFANVGFIGYPVVQAVFGPDAVLYAAIFNVPFNFLAFTVGVAFLKDREGGAEDSQPFDWKDLVSPVQIACIAAIVLAVLNVRSLGPLEDAIVSVGDMTTPSALLIVGSSMARYSPLSMLTNLRAYAAAACRLVVAPVLSWLVFRPFVEDPLLLGVIVIVAAMPTASNGSMLCIKHNPDFLKPMVQCTFLSTVFAIVTIPLVSTLVS